jgi:uncharacterized damage-inducible protein DinB
MLQEIKELSDHMFWADMTIWSEVRKIKQDKDTKNIFDLLFHLHSVQHAYLSIWKDESLRYFGKIKFDKLDEIYEWALDFHKKYRIFINDLEDSKLHMKIKIPWTGQLENKLRKPPEDANLIQTIHQVIMHSTYHRGQINKEIRKIGGEPPLTDLIYWIWLGKPEAEGIEK